MNVEASRFLEHVAAVLDIPDDLYEEAVAKYTDLGEWLERKDAAVHRNPPEIYPQGSFRLGTMIRPISDSDEYDIDLVYKRDLQKQSTSHQQLKTEAGEHLADYIEDKQREGEESISLSESRRSWTLQYPDRFHMDVLPAIPDADGRANAILITDRELTRWQFSNPIDYAEWFKKRMIARFREKRAAMAQAIKASVEDVPEWSVKTALQRAVQILKRHRDIRFQHDPLDVKPASIIISTLAAKAYDNEADLATALTKLVRDMPMHIEKRDGVYWVPNPVNHEENFADRWVGRPDRAQAFFEWLGAVPTDLVKADQAVDIAGLGACLTAVLGEGVVNEALDRTTGVITSATAADLIRVGGKCAGNHRGLALPCGVAHVHIADMDVAVSDHEVVVAGNVLHWELDDGGRLYRIEGGAKGSDLILDSHRACGGEGGMFRREVKLQECRAEFFVRCPHKRILLLGRKVHESAGQFGDECSRRFQPCRHVDHRKQGL